jgi:hypothetical protein
MYVRPSSSGFGQVVPPTVATAASIAATGIATTTSILATLGLVSATIPVIGAAVAALVGIGIAIANVFKGCGQTCIQATSIANQAGALLVQNVNAYTGSPIRTVSMQAAALNTFDTTWQALQQACGWNADGSYVQGALGAAGQRCVTDRQRGACTWKASPGGWNADGTFTPWGAAGSGNACWNWFIGMRDPIANDPNVQPDPTPSVTSDVSSVVSSIPATVGGISTPLLIGGGLLLAYLVSDL